MLFAAHYCLAIKVLWINCLELTLGLLLVGSVSKCMPVPIRSNLELKNVNS